jgi:transketolase
MNHTHNAMRDIFIQGIFERMSDDPSLFFVAADFGSPRLDQLREKFSDRFINVGIAEQNLINVSSGLALEGYTVYAYAIAPFLTMRAYESIRNNISLIQQIRPLNINLVGVGAGLSYDVSGPTHHCLEDLSVMRTLPNIEVLSPSDCVMAEKLIDYSRKHKRPKYIRFDSKPVADIYEQNNCPAIEDSFKTLKKGSDVCLVTTGFMTHTGLKAVELLTQKGINAGLVDLYSLRPLREDALRNELSSYKHVVTIEEGFITKAGMDSVINNLLKETTIKTINLGFEDKHVFKMGNRAHLHKLHALDPEGITDTVINLLKGGASIA